MTCPRRNHYLGTAYPDVSTGNFHVSMTKLSMSTGNFHVSTTNPYTAKENPYISTRNSDVCATNPAVPSVTPWFDVGCDVRCRVSDTDVIQEDMPIRSKPRVARQLMSDITPRPPDVRPHSSPVPPGYSQLISEVRDRASELWRLTAGASPPLFAHGG